MLAKNEHPGASNWGRAAITAVAAAMSSGRTSRSGWVVPVE